MKICGFALKRNLENRFQAFACKLNLHRYTEVLAGSKGSGHSYEVDVWSIGVIMYTLLVGTPPFQTTDVHATYKRIRANAYEFPERPAVSKSARDLIRWSLAPKPCDRPKIADIAAHPLLRAGFPEWVMPPPKLIQSRGAYLHSSTLQAVFYSRC